MISARQYKAQLADAILSDNQRAAAKRWLFDCEARGTEYLRGIRKFSADKLARASADAVNASQVAEAIASEVQSGAMDPVEGMQELRRLAAIVEEAQTVLPDVQADLERVNAMEPLEAFDQLMERFPPMEARIPLPPELPRAQQVTA